MMAYAELSGWLRDLTGIPSHFLYWKLSVLFIAPSGFLLPWLLLMSTVPSLISSFFL